MGKREGKGKRKGKGGGDESFIHTYLLGFESGGFFFPGGGIGVIFVEIERI